GGHDPLPHVRRPHRHAVAGRDTRRRRRPRRDIHTGRELREREPLALVVHGDGVAEPFRRVLDEPRDRPPSQVAAPRLRHSANGSTIFANRSISSSTTSRDPCVSPSTVSRTPSEAKYSILPGSG